MAGREPPEITLTTAATPPITQTTTTTYTIGARRARNTTTSTQSTNNNSLRPTTPNNDTEPFPSLPPSTPNSPANRNSDYFAQPPLQYQVRTRPISIRRLPSSSDVQEASSGRPRSGSGLTRRRTNTGPSREQPSDNATAGLSALPGHYEVGAPGGMEPIVEGQEAHHGQPGLSVDNDDQQGARAGRSGSTRLRRASNAARSMISKLSDDPEEDRLRRGRGQTGYGHEYESDVVDYLDVLDPEVSTLTTLTNVQNAMFVPDIPFLNRYYNRRPTYELSRKPSQITETSDDSIARPQITRQISRVVSRKAVPPTPEPPEVPPKTEEQEERVGRIGTSKTPELGSEMAEGPARRFSVTSQVEEEHYAVLPHGVTLEGWSQEDVDALDDYVRHMLHSRRNRFKRSMKGFGKYIRKRKLVRFPVTTCC